MSTNLQKHVQVDESTGEVLPVEADFSLIAEELVAAARGQGIELTGPKWSPDRPDPTSVADRVGGRDGGPSRL